MEQFDGSSLESDNHSVALSGTEIDFKGFSSSNDSAVSNPKLLLKQFIGDNKDVICFPLTRANPTADMKVQPELSKNLPQHAGTTLRTRLRDTAVETDVELQYATPAKRRRLVSNKQTKICMPSKDFVNSKPSTCQKGGGVSYSAIKSENCRRSKHHSNHQIRCSTESTSDFPVSSPTMPSVGNGIMGRQMFQRNILPVNAFEHNLALLTAEKPQMTLKEKISAWQCDMEFSDVEDVGNFDDLFKEHEELKKTVLGATKNVNKKSKDVKNQYNFIEFRAKVIRNIKTTVPLNANRDQPMNSLRYQSRTATDIDNKKCFQIERSTGKQSATPTVTSSSKSEIVCNVKFKQKQRDYIDLGKSSLEKSNSHGKILRRHSFEEHSQHDFDLEVSITKPLAEMLEKHRSQSNLMKLHSPPLILKQPSTNEDSSFEICNPHRKIDRSKTNSKCLIQMRQDFSNEKKTLHLQEKKSELFKLPKLPKLPQKYTNTLTSRTPVVHSNKGLKSIKVSSSSSQKAIELDDPFSHTSNSNCHQQHEFCNYLGLTGMSTASAVANAVAELAKCNLARRSLRVRRLQQQERKDKNQVTKQTCKADKTTQSLNVTDLTQDQKNKSYFSNKANILRSRKKLRGPKLMEASNPHKNACNTMRVLTENNEKEPEIKILCHLSSDADKTAISRNCIKEKTAPTRETLCRHSNSNVSLNIKSTSQCSSVCEADTLKEEYNTSTFTQNVVVQKLHMNNTSTKEIKNSSNPKNSSYITQKESILMSSDLNKSTVVNQKLYNKFQEFLEASRKIKPSIYIVQTLNSTGIKQHNKSEGENLSEIGAAKPPTIFCIQQNRSNCNKKNNNYLLNKVKRSSFQSLALRKRKKKERLRKLLSQPICHKKHQQTQRKRKSLLLRTIKCISDIDNKAKKEFDKAIDTDIKLCSATLSVTSENDKPTYSEIIPILKQSFQQDSSCEILPRQIQLNKEKEVNHRMLKKVAGKKLDNNSKNLYQRQLYNHKSIPSNRSNTVTNAREIAISRKKKLTNRIITSSADTCSDNKHLNTSTILTSRIVLNKNIPKASKSYAVLHNTNETVVVSSTTNSYDEATLLKLNDSHVHFEQEGDLSKTSYVILTKEQGTQSDAGSNSIHYLSTPAKALASPIKSDNGRVDYLYYEMDVLIVVQEFCISFWKYFKLINVLSAPQYNCQPSHKIVTNNPSIQELKASSSSIPLTRDNTTTITVTKCEWIPLGECRRLIDDIEIRTSYANRICTHNSIPIYMEMRCRFVPRERRECNLLSMYVNVYYYNDEDMVAKMHSIQLDAVQSIPSEVIYTTLTESRYFVMTWPQENILGKTRTGLCKYSLTPNMDTLASIREFKNMRHIIRYLECSSDDKLLGFGDTQLTIWNHRSGDILMNYDLDIELGRNLGSIYYPSLEIGQNSMMLLFQYAPNLGKDAEAPAELLIIACSISHISPSHRILRRYNLLHPAFSYLSNATNTGEHLIITAQNDEEIWISCADANTITHVPAQSTRRFYARGRTQLIELTSETLTVDSFANHVLKLAAKTNIKLNVSRSSV